MSKFSLLLSGIFSAMRTVGAAMLGVRDKDHHATDSAGLSIVVLVVVAVLFMSIFVGVLVFLAASIAHGV